MSERLDKVANVVLVTALPLGSVLFAFAAQKPWQAAVMGILSGWLILDAMIELGLTAFVRREPDSFHEDRDW